MLSFNQDDKRSQNCSICLQSVIRPDTLFLAKSNFAQKEGVSMNKKSLTIFSILMATIFSLGIFSIYAITAQHVNAQQTYITPEKAQQIALNATGGGIVTKLKQDNHRGYDKYVVTVHNGQTKHDIEINATDGTIIKHNQKLEKEPYNKAVYTGEKINAEQAKATALNIAGNGEVVKCKFTNGKKGPKYDITIVNGDNKYEVDVNAYTNTVIKYEQKMVTELKIYPTEQMIPLTQAKDIARQQAGSGTIIKCTLDYKKEYRTPVYDIDVVKNGVKYKYHINSLDGSIMKYDIDYTYSANEKR